MRRFALLIALPLATAIAARDGQPQSPSRAPSYSNPVLPGDYPDPSVIRVGRDYWATATTSQWAPIFPLLHSTDLVNWELRGAVFQTPPSWSAGSYWAPEISADGGRFFVYYTARKKEGPPSTLPGGTVSRSNGPLCVAVADAARPEGPYTDRGALVCQEVGSIDAVAVRDENGRRYLVWKEDGNSRKLPTPLWAQPLSDDGIRLVGEKTEILRNEAPWEAHLIEGPYILRRGDWFYMFYSADACCGRRCNYKLGVARSRKLLGPWERFPGNPILAGNEQWKCPGHGTIVQDQAGRTYLLYHAYEASTFEFVGRQGLLDEVTWNADGWPAIHGGKGPSGSAPSPSTVTQRRASTLLEDDFNEAGLDPGWQWPWDQTSAPSVEPAPVHAGRGRGRGGWLRLTTGNASIAIAARPIRNANYAATAAVDVASIAPGASAGLAAFGNRDNAIAVTVERAGEAASGTPLSVVVWQTQKGERRTLATTQAPAATVLHLRLSAKDRTRFEFSVSHDGQTWKTVGGAQGEYLPPWDLAVRVALLVSGPPTSSARFGGFKLESP